MRKLIILLSLIVTLGPTTWAQQLVQVQLADGKAPQTLKVFEGDTLCYEAVDSMLFVGKGAVYKVGQIADISIGGEYDDSRKVGWYNAEQNGTSVFVPQWNDPSKDYTCYYALEAKNGLCTGLRYRVESDNEALLDEYWMNNYDDECEPTGRNGRHGYTRRTLSRQRRLRLTSSAMWLGNPETADYALWTSNHEISVGFGSLLEGCPLDEARLLLMWWNGEATRLPASLLPRQLPFGTYDAATSTYHACSNWLRSDCTISLNWNDDHTRVVGSTMVWECQWEEVARWIYADVAGSADANLSISRDGRRITFTERYTDGDGQPASVSFEQAWHDLMLFDMDWMNPEPVR